MNQLHFLLHRMASRGIARNLVLAQSGIDADEAIRPGFIPTPTQFRQVLRNIVDLAPPGIGLMMGLESNVQDHGVLGHAALASATLKDIERLHRRYACLLGEYTLFTDCITPDEWQIEFAVKFPAGDLMPFLIEELMARGKRTLTIYAGIEPPLKLIRLAYPAPAHEQLYHDIFRCPIQFGQDRNMMIIDSTYLELPAAFSNPEVSRLCEEHCERLLGRLGESNRVGNAIRRDLILNPGRNPTLAEMAETLKVSTATLRRRLRDEGENYQAILESVRREMAIDYLTSTDLSPKEIGFQLGYSNVHNFRRAFKTWTGTTVSQYRR